MTIYTLTIWIRLLKAYVILKLPSKQLLNKILRLIHKLL